MLFFENRKRAFGPLDKKELKEKLREYRELFIRTPSMIIEYKYDPSDNFVTRVEWYPRQDTNFCAQGYRETAQINEIGFPSIGYILPQ